MKRRIGITFLVCLIAFVGFNYFDMTKSFYLQSENKENKVEVAAEDDVKRVAITFDDGPDEKYTELLLDGLKSRGVKATFFVVGKKIEGNESIIRRMKEEGHLIGNHSYNHSELYKLSLEEATKEIKKTNELIYEITGYCPEFLRPPFGSWNRKCDCPEEMIPVYWDIDPLDWQVQNATVVVSNVIDEVEDGDIILLHDIFQSSVEAAFAIIDCLQYSGYEFVTVDELILN